MKIAISLSFVVFFVVGGTVFDSKGPKCTTKPGKNCHENKCTKIDGSCDCHSSCCLGYCGKDHKCTCTNKYSACVGNEECCVGTCVNISTMGNVCYCNEISENCTVGNDATCCRGICDSQSKKCKCIDKIGMCKSDKECCNGKCSNDKCGCAANGGACKVTSDCCGGICENEKCRTCVYNFEGSCNVKSDCCRGNCSDGSCACQSSTDACRDDNDCCGGTCSSGKCDCVPYYDDSGSPNCNPKVPDACCFGTCRLNSNKDAFQCQGSLPNSECNFGYDCLSNVCVNNRCS